MKKINQKIITSIFIFLIVLLLSISIILANNVSNKENNKIDKEKILYEIKYLDNEIVYMYNLLNMNKIQIDWKKMQNHTNNLYNYWNSTILDLNNLDIDKKYLKDFGENLDNLSLSIKYQNKRSSLTDLIKLYNKLIIYLEDLGYENYQKILLTKYNLLLASSYVETENWTLVYEYISKSSNNIYEVVSALNINEYTQYNINQAYVAIKEMENLLNIRDIDVFNIKCQIALDKLENL